MLQRTLSTLALWTIVFCALYFGGMWGAGALLLVLSVLAQREYYGLRQAAGAPVYVGWGMAIGVCWLALVITLPFFLAPVFFLLMLLLSLVLFVKAPPSEGHLRGIVETMFGVLYVPFLLSFFVGLAYCTVQWREVAGSATEGAAPLYVSHSVGGVWLAVLVVAIAKFADVGGLLVGKTCGKHKIAPSISPKKSWEGLAGSVLFSILVMLFAYYLPLWCPNAQQWDKMMPLWAWVVFAAIIAAVSLLSDLTESVIKRVADKKDSGCVIPGIGGALDLCDSLLFTGPLALILMAVLLVVN